MTSHYVTSGVNRHLHHSVCEQQVCLKGWFTWPETNTQKISWYLRNDVIISIKWGLVSGWLPDIPSGQTGPEIYIGLSSASCEFLLNLTSNNTKQQMFFTAITHSELSWSLVEEVRIFLYGCCCSCSCRRRSSMMNTISISFIQKQCNSSC